MTTNNNKQRVTLFVYPSILKQAKAQAIVEGRTLTSLVEKALIRYLPKETLIKKDYIHVDPDP
jgi:ribosomal protein L13